jgi:hypothetical protein
MDEPNQSRPSRFPGALVGFLAGGALLVIALIAGLGWFGIQEVTRQARAALQVNPVIAEHIGEIELLEIDLPGTGEVAGAETIVFSVVGARGSGTIAADLVTVDADTEKVVGGELRLADGRVFPLTPEPTTPEAEPEAPSPGG